MVQGKVEICGVNTAKPASCPERDQTLFRQCGKCGRSVPDRLYRSDQGHRQF